MRWDKSQWIAEAAQAAVLARSDVERLWMMVGFLAAILEARDTELALMRERMYPDRLVAELDARPHYPVSLADVLPLPAPTEAEDFSARARAVQVRTKMRRLALKAAHKRRVKQQRANRGDRTLSW